VLDIGTAAGWALLCLALLSTMSPYSARVGSVIATADVRSGEAVFHYVNSVGLVFLANAPPDLVCASLLGHSNSTVALGGVVEGVRCSPPPTSFNGTFSLEVSLGGRELTLQGWAEAR